MPQASDIPADNFDELLAWLNPDREVAARVYEEIRRDLIKIFGWNHCADPEGLADETFDRVAEKAPRIKDTYEGDPRHYFYGVARNLMKEEQKNVKFHVPIEDVDLAAEEPDELEEETAEKLAECLQACLGKLTYERRKLILNYYSREKQAKIDHRAKMARQLDISTRTLRVRMYRIRAVLEDCIERCLNKNEVKNETD